MAEAELWWEPGTKTAYHALTFGFLIGELVRRATGQPISRVLRRNARRSGWSAAVQPSAHQGDHRPGADRRRRTVRESSDLDAGTAARPTRIVGATSSDKLRHAGDGWQRGLGGYRQWRELRADQEPVRAERSRGCRRDRQPGGRYYCSVVTACERTADPPRPSGRGG
ncbi:serine hydrolase [Kribbella ginsengisoli]|uniref:serine hydrolase n=1 Tax=Kribbella ginsengisoli TaxID=363865 RepID=UPI003CD08FF7